MNLPCCSSCSRTTGPPSPSRQRISPVLPSVAVPLLGLTCWPFSSHTWTAAADGTWPRAASARASETEVLSTRGLCRAAATGFLGSEQLLGNEPAPQHVVHAQPERRLGLGAENDLVVALHRQPLELFGFRI